MFCCFCSLIHQGRGITSPVSSILPVVMGCLDAPNVSMFWEVGVALIIFAFVPPSGRKIRIWTSSDVSLASCILDWVSFLHYVSFAVITDLNGFLQVFPTSLALLKIEVKEPCKVTDFSYTTFIVALKFSSVFVWLVVKCTTVSV